MGRTRYSFHGNSMNDLLSHCGLIDAKIRASDKDLPVSSSFSDDIGDHEFKRSWFK